MNAEILAVGTELLLGQIVNTNAQYISKRLADYGVNVYFHSVVGDNETRLKQALTVAFERSDCIIITGGLGPTEDDLTKETVSTLLGVPFLFHEPSWERMKQYFTTDAIPMNNKKQAYAFVGGDVLQNDQGTAPGHWLVHNHKIIILLPGPPREMKYMFEHYVVPKLIQSLPKEERIYSKVLHFFGIGESKLEEELTDIISSSTNPTLAPLAGDDEVVIRITAKTETENEANKKINEIKLRILERVGEFYYGDDDTTLLSLVIEQLHKLKLTVATAESMTGGALGAMLTELPGASQHYCGGVVTYTNDMKKNLLHVNDETLEKYGAVSEACAKEMAENIRKQCGAQIGISLTGEAGPIASEEHPVGTVFVGLSYKDTETKVYRLQLRGNRSRIRNRAVLHTLFKLVQQLQSEEENKNVSN